MTLEQHVGDVIRGKSALASFKAVIKGSPELKADAERLLSAIDPRVFERCWLSQKRHQILSRALED